MKLPVPKSVMSLENATIILRKAGYYPFTDPRTKEDSYILRLGPDKYPRFHLYIESEGNNLSFNLHIDQKKASYSGTSRHAGEYDGPNVEREIQRISRWITAEIGYRFITPSNNKTTNGRTQSSQAYTNNSQSTNTQTKKPAQPRKKFGGIF